MDSYDSIINTLSILVSILEEHSDEEIYQSAIMLKNKASDYLNNEKNEIIRIANANDISLNEIGFAGQSDS